METLLTAASGGKPKPALVFVGATVQDSLAATAVAMGWMEQPQTVAVGRVSSCWGAAESLRKEHLPRLTWLLASQSTCCQLTGASHHRAAYPERCGTRASSVKPAAPSPSCAARYGQTSMRAHPLLACTFLLPAVVSEPSKAFSLSSDALSSGSSVAPQYSGSHLFHRIAGSCGVMAGICTRRQGDDGPPARVIVFAATEEQAAAIAEPLRNVLWGEHSIAVLLPGGQEPIQVRGDKLLQAHPSLRLPQQRPDHFMCE